ncbi:MAG: hypothetical protein U1F10_10540 [Burkholderiales bacterium]
MTAIRAFLRAVTASLLIALAAPQPAAAVDWTDLWWNQNESGWGLNFVQASDFVFATFFVYGPNNQPFWYTGQMSVDANGVWSGPLYQTTGTYLANPWNGIDKSATQVGTVTFVPTSSYAGTLTYNVNSVNVTKQITRQTLKTIPLGGKYSGAYLSIYSNCNNSSFNGAATYFSNITVSQTNGGNLTLTFDADVTLSMSGPYAQDGQLYRIPNASYLLNGNKLIAQVTQIKATAQGIEGEWAANVGAAYPGCVEQGYFSALYITN